MDVLLASIDEAFNKRSWHGTNLRGSLRGLSFEEASWRPSPGRHNIYELAMHAAYWKYALRRRLTGEKRGSFAFKGSNWFPMPPEATEASWRDVVQLLDAEHRAVRDAVAGLKKITPKLRGLIAGLAAHDLYHAGQIQLLKRLQK
jgi:uncharacterized damage-inducible protein DinB